MRYDSQFVLYNDTEDSPASHDTAPLENTLPTHSILELDSGTTAKYSEDINPQRDLAQLQEHTSSTSRNDSINWILLPINRLQQLAIKLQLSPTFSPMEEPLHTAMQEDTDTLSAT